MPAPVAITNAPAVATSSAAMAMAAGSKDDNAPAMDEVYRSPLPWEALRRR